MCCLHSYLLTMLFNLMLQPMSGIPAIGTMNGQGPSVDRCEMLTTTRSGRAAIHGVEMSDVISVPVASPTESGTEHLRLTAGEPGMDEGTAAAATSTSGDVSASEKVAEERPGLPESASECHEKPEKLDRRLVASRPFSIDVDDRSLEDSQLEQLENVQVAIKVFPFLTSLDLLVCRSGFGSCACMHRMYTVSG